ncbi:MAG: hypothetical protein JWR26_2178 [Pedosphaera sp.]|nr:hypothetical protein [Pedosphaera sp.]
MWDDLAHLGGGLAQLGGTLKSISVNALATEKDGETTDGEGGTQMRRTREGSRVTTHCLGGSPSLAEMRVMAGKLESELLAPSHPGLRQACSAGATYPSDQPRRSAGNFDLASGASSRAVKVSFVILFMLIFFFITEP